MAQIQTLLSGALLAAVLGLPVTTSAAPATDDAAIAAGERMYRQGVLPSGERMTGIVQGDIALNGEQVICGYCHRRSGIGAAEGQNVAPPVTGDMLYQPLRVPTSKPPLAPEIRPAYTDETLKRAIREGIGADGQPLGPLMPRYRLSDEQLDILLGYLKSMTTEPDPGVDDENIYFATIVSSTADPASRKAYLDVFESYFQQKNVETRHESQRAEHAPRHKAWQYEPYRKWVLRIWELEGAPDSWPQQLQSHYDSAPVFAVIGGLAPGSWEPIHQFCEANEVPCLFPNTDLPVANDKSFYSVYFSNGVALEADSIAEHLSRDGLISSKTVQVRVQGDPEGQEASERLADHIRRHGGQAIDRVLDSSSALTRDSWLDLASEASEGVLMLWLGPDQTDGLWSAFPSLLADGKAPKRVYLATSFYGTEGHSIPPDVRDRIYLAHAYELPSRLPGLLARSTGWLKSKKIFDPDESVLQANAFFALTMTRGGVSAIRGFFKRDYLLERIEHMAENASYTSVYPRFSLAPGQRFLSRGAYILQFEPGGSGKLVAKTDWMVPQTN